LAGSRHRARPIPARRAPRGARANAIGIRRIVVPAISEEAKNFYVALGFDPSPREPMTPMVALSGIKAALS
jgi:hypothetical protein